MSFSENFTAQQSASVYSTMVVTDTSTGSNVLITKRRVYFIQANLDYLTTDATTHDYFDWAYADASITILNLLDKDYALNVKVEWLDVSNTVLYSKTILNGYPAYEEAFLYSLTMAQTSNPQLINNQNYWLSKITLRTQVDDAAQAITQGNDIYSAQASYNRGMYLVNNPQVFF